MITGLSPIGITLYGLALNLYPPAFRREFGAEMLRDFCESSQEQRPNGLLRLWGHTLADLLWTLIVEWSRTLTPVIALMAATATFLSLEMLCHVIQPPRLSDMSTRTSDADMLTLETLVTTVLLVVVAVLLITHWSVRPFGDRRR
jgi:hypothetical protein